MKILPIALVAYVLLSAWLLSRANQQRKEVLALRATVATYQIDFNASQKDLTSCKKDVEFMKQGLEDIISIKEGKIK